MKNLCVFVLAGALFGLGCSGGKPVGNTEGSPRPDVRSRYESPKGPLPASARFQSRRIFPRFLVISAVEGDVIASDKNDTVVSIAVGSEAIEGPITLKITAPPELKFEKETLVLPKGEKIAKLKVAVAPGTQRDKDRGYHFKVRASADKAEDHEDDLNSITVLAAQK
jgi:hypothetical protein